MRTSLFIFFGAIALALLLVVGWQRVSLTRLRVQNEEFASQLSAQATGAPSITESSEEIERLRRDAQEVHKLRGEVSALRRQIAEMLKLTNEPGRYPGMVVPVADPARGQVQDEVEAQKEEEKRVGIAKLNGLKQWMLAFHKYSEANNGALPESFAQAGGFFDNATTFNLDLDQYEIVYRGPISKLTEPSRTIVIREKEARRAWNGRWTKGYGFADGHSEIHAEASPDFSKWERERTVAPAPP
jgi:hypothetical protein